jgi:hypothetical protein
MRPWFLLLAALAWNGCSTCDPPPFDPSSRIAPNAPEYRLEHSQPPPSPPMPLMYPLQQQPDRLPKSYEKYLKPQ